MAVHYRTQGFFIKKTDRGEDGQLFTVYTKDFGRVNVLGKAIRKTKSKLRSGAELFYLSEIEFIQGKTQKTLTDTILVEKFFGIRQDLKRLKIAREICGTLDNFVSKEEKDELVWRLLKESFQKLNEWKIGKAPDIIHHYFFWNLISILGYDPEFRECTINGVKVDCDLVKILKVILRRDWQILSRLRIEPRHLKLLKKACEWYTKEIIA